MDVTTGFSPIARVLIVMAAIAILLIFLRLAAPIIAPLLLAVFIAIVATPLLRWMRRRGLPKWFALAVIVLVLLDVGSIFALVTTGALEGLRESLPGYRERFTLLAQQAEYWLESSGITGSYEALSDVFNPANAIILVRAALSSVSGAFANGFLILLAVIFMLLEAPDLKTKVKKAFHFTKESDARLLRASSAVNRYLLIKTLTSLATALCVWVLLWSLGIDFAILWTILAFVLNFVPIVGAILMTIPAVLMALLQTDLQTTLLVGVGYIVINTVIGNILEPRFMGRGLGISALAVFLSILFWGWLLGTVGVFLSVPLTMALMIALDASPTTRPIAVLLGPSLPKPLPNEDTSSVDATAD